MKNRKTSKLMIEEIASITDTKVSNWKYCEELNTLYLKRGVMILSESLKRLLNSKYMCCISADGKLVVYVYENERKKG